MDNLISSPIQITATIFIIIGMVTAVCGNLYSIYEYFALRRFKLSAYNNGILILQIVQSIPLNPSFASVGKVLQTDYGQFKFIDEQVCLFRYSPKRWLSSLGFGPKIAVKGKITWKDGQAHVEGSIGTGKVVIFLGNLVFLLGGFFLLYYSNIDERFFIIAFISGVYTINFLAHLYAIQRSKRQIQNLLNELTVYMGGEAALNRTRIDTLLILIEDTLRQTLKELLNRKKISISLNSTYLLITCVMSLVMSIGIIILLGYTIVCLILPYIFFGGIGSVASLIYIGISFYRSKEVYSFLTVQEGGVIGFLGYFTCCITILLLWLPIFFIIMIMAPEEISGSPAETIISIVISYVMVFLFSIPHIIAGAITVLIFNKIILK